MNRVLIGITGFLAGVSAVLVILLVVEQDENAALSMENGQLRNQVSIANQDNNKLKANLNELAFEASKLIESKTIVQKQIAGFGRELIVG